MGIGKSVNRVVSLLLAMAFVFTNIAYSSEANLRVPLQLQTEAGQRRAQETMDAANTDTVSEKLASNTGIMSNNVQEFLENIKGVLEFDVEGNVVVINADELRSRTIDYLAREAALNGNNDVKVAAQFIIRSAAASLGIIPASINDLYMARKNNAWANMSVPAVNIRADGYETARDVFWAARELNVGAIILELAKSEARYSGQSVGEFAAVGFAAAIKEGHTGPIFLQGDHYQIDKKKYDQDPQKEIASLKKFIRESLLAGEYNIDLDPSTLVNEEALDEIVAFENVLVSEKLRDNPKLAQGLDETGLKALRNKLIDELVLTDEQRARLDALYEKLHAETAKVTMEFIRYIRGLEKELLGGKVTVSIGIEERHIDNPKHKNNPSTVRGSIALASKILKMCADESLVGPSKIALQTGTMHGLGGKVDFGIYERHLTAVPSIGIAVFVQHGASTIKDRNDFKKMPIVGVGEVHLATEYQKITFGTDAKMMPDLAERMARYLEDLMVKNPDTYGKNFGDKWARAFNDPIQAGKTRSQIIAEILGDELPEYGISMEKGLPVKLRGSLKDLTKELAGPFKNDIWNVPANAREAVRQAMRKEFSEIFQMLGASETKQLVESIIPVAKQPVILSQRPEALTQAMRNDAEGQKLASNETADNLNVKIEHATLMAEEGIQNPEGFKRLINQLLDNPVTSIAVAVIAERPAEIDELRAALIPADFDALKGRGVKFSVLDMGAIKDAKAQYPDSINIQEGFEVFSITANLRDYDRLVQAIDQGV